MRKVPVELFAPDAPTPVEKPVPALASPMDDLPRIERPISSTPPPQEKLEKPKQALPTTGVFTRLAELNDEKKSPQADMTASGQVSKSASLQVDKHASLQVDKSAGPQADMTRESYIRGWLEMKASKRLTFRCPPDIWGKIEELKVQVHQRHKVKLSAAAMLTAAMASLFWDIEHNDPASLSYKLLLELKKEEGVEE
jgi:hypothetical protein